MIGSLHERQLEVPESLYDDRVREDVEQPDGEGEEDGDGRDDVGVGEDAADSLDDGLSEALAGVSGADQTSTTPSLRPSQHQPAVEEAEPLRLGVHLQEDLRSLQSSPASPQIQRVASEASPEVEFSRVSDTFSLIENWHEMV